MGPTTQTTTTAPSNPDVNPTLSKLLKGVQGAYDANPQGTFFDDSLYAGVGEGTRGAWAGGYTAANNPNFAGGIGGALEDFGKVARGDFLNNVDPEYQAMIDRTANETAADVNAAMGADGRYGSNVHTGALVDQIGGLRTRANVDNRRFELARQSEAARLMPELLQANMLPSQLAGQIGAMQDADRQATRQGDFDRFTRKANAQTDLLAKLSSILAGNAAVGGSSTTSPIQQPNPLQLLLGGGLGLAALL